MKKRLFNMEKNIMKINDVNYSIMAVEKAKNIESIKKMLKSINEN